MERAKVEGTATQRAMNRVMMKAKEKESNQVKVTETEKVVETTTATEDPYPYKFLGYSAFLVKIALVAQSSEAIDTDKAAIEEVI